MRHVNKKPEFALAVQAALEFEYNEPEWDYTECVIPQNLSNITQQAIDVYLRQQKPDGTIDGNGWWQTANGYTAIALRDLWSGTRQNYHQLATALRGCERSNLPHESFINDWNDDSLWWALCCVHMYSIGNHPWFLDRARDIWQHARKSVCTRGQEFFDGKDMEGAVFWKSTGPDDDHINAISTGLFAELSVRLALIRQSATSGSGPSPEEYLEYARCSLGWILRCRYLPREGFVLDHIELRKQKAVDWIFTYNTGVALGTCALLYEATGEDEYMILACHMARRSMMRKIWVEDDGVLTEPRAYGRNKHDPLQNGDGVGFKAVLVRQLGTLYDVLVRTKCPKVVRPWKTAALIKRFVNVNYRSQQRCNTDGAGRYGPWWNGPFEFPTSHSQLAVLDVMAAVVLVNKPRSTPEMHSFCSRADVVA